MRPISIFVRITSNKYFSSNNSNGNITSVRAARCSGKERVETSECYYSIVIQNLDKVDFIFLTINKCLPQ